ncbi:hypothetical protein G0Q06_06450 [Puniceicoccales bacterium CK1056]|uniref:Uncharacterized protein n=1 Tax=Oceanipulchritudo coccoides TaxID=2706888 RepID=A0A6B2LZD3_9BACT|nr:hypothetical protein [Oceanipulchritudo coccoides]NDV62081.1 hypothetical protein [Oceanipulchritudo coccoides]
MKNSFYPILRKSLSASAALLALACTVHADTLAFIAADDDYATVANWNNVTAGAPATALPSAGDTAVINGGRIANLASDVSGSVPTSLVIPNNTSEGTLNIDAGGALVVTGLVVDSTNDGIGTVNINGGALTVNGTAAIGALGLVSISSGSYTSTTTASHFLGGTDSAPVTGSYEISGGTLQTSQAPGSFLQLTTEYLGISGGTVDFSSATVVGYLGSTVSVTGDTATIDFGSSLLVNNASRATTFEFNFNATGISPIKVDGTTRLNNATIVIDGTNYTGGTGSFPLFTGTGYDQIGGISAIVTVLGFPGFSVSMNINDTTDVFELVLSPAAAAGPNVFNKPNGDYNNALNWSLARVPVAGDTAVINNNNIANLDTDASAAVPDTLRVGNQPANTGTLNINAGGKLTASLIQVSTAGAADVLAVNAGGTLECLGLVSLVNAAGTLQVSGVGAVYRNSSNTTDPTKAITTGAGTLSVTNGGTVEVNNPANLNAVTDFKNNTVTVDGGSIVSDARIRFGFGGTTTLNIGGVGSLVAPKDFMISGAGTILNYTFDANGVGRIDCAGFAHLQNLTINIQAAALAGGGGAGLDSVFDLVDTQNVASLPLAVNVTGAAGTQGVDWFVRQDTFLNLFQIVFGDPPLEPIFLDVSESAGTLTITVDAADSKTGFDYTLESSSVLSGWTPVETKPGTGADLSFTDPAPTAGDKAFYRVSTAPQ